MGLPEKVIDRATELLQIINENTDSKEQVTSRKALSDVESKFHLLRTDTTNAEFNRFFIYIKK